MKSSCHGFVPKGADWFSVESERDWFAAVECENWMSINAHGNAYLLNETKYPMDRSKVASVSLVK